MKGKMQMQGRFWMMACAAVVLTACSSAGFGPRPAPLGRSDAPVGGTCNAEGARAVVGKGASAQAVEQARVAAGARMARVLHPGQVVTQEFDGERLNLDVNAKGVVLAVRCG